jgi:MFS transporter, DHA2 family, multidrug resistance protein
LKIRSSSIQDMMFWQIAPSQLAAGAFLMFAFVPLMGLPISSVPAHDIASAAGLSNFARTVVSAVAVAIATTIWTDDGIRKGAQLTDALNRPGETLLCTERSWSQQPAVASGFVRRRP